MTGGSSLADAAASSLAMYSAPTWVWTVTCTFGVAALNSSTIWLKKLPSGPVKGFQTTSSTGLAGGWSSPPASPDADGDAAPSVGAASLGAAAEGSAPPALALAPPSPPLQAATTMTMVP